MGANESSFHGKVKMSEVVFLFLPLLWRSWRRNKFVKQLCRAATGTTSTITCRQLSMISSSPVPGGAICSAFLLVIFGGSFMFSNLGAAFAIQLSSHGPDQDFSPSELSQSRSSPSAGSQHPFRLLQPREDLHEATSSSRPPPAPARAHPLQLSRRSSSGFGSWSDFEQLGTTSLNVGPPHQDLHAALPPGERSFFGESSSSSASAQAMQHRRSSRGTSSSSQKKTKHSFQQHHLQVPSEGVSLGSLLRQSPDKSTSLKHHLRKTSSTTHGSGHLLTESGVSTQLPDESLSRFTQLDSTNSLLSPTHGGAHQGGGELFSSLSSRFSSRDRESMMMSSTRSTGSRERPIASLNSLNLSTEGGGLMFGSTQLPHLQLLENPDEDILSSRSNAFSENSRESKMQLSVGEEGRGDSRSSGGGGTGTISGAGGQQRDLQHQSQPRSGLRLPDVIIPGENGSTFNTMSSVRTDALIDNFYHDPSNSHDGYISPRQYLSDGGIVLTASQDSLGGDDGALGMITSDPCFGLPRLGGPSRGTTLARGPSSMLRGGRAVESSPIESSTLAGASNYGSSNRLTQSTESCGTVWSENDNDPGTGSSPELRGRLCGDFYTNLGAGREDNSTWGSCTTLDAFRSTCWYQHCPSGLEDEDHNVVNRSTSSPTSTRHYDHYNHIHNQFERDNHDDAPNPPTSPIEKCLKRPSLLKRAAVGLTGLTAAIGGACFVQSPGGQQLVHALSSSMLGTGGNLNFPFGAGAGEANTRLNNYPSVAATAFARTMNPNPWSIKGAPRAKAAEEDDAGGTRGAGSTSSQHRPDTTSTSSSQRKNISHDEPQSSYLAAAAIQQDDRTKVNAEQFAKLQSAWSDLAEFSEVFGRNGFRTLYESVLFPWVTTARLAQQPSSSASSGGSTSSVVDNDNGFVGEMQNSFVAQGEQPGSGAAEEAAKQLRHWMQLFSWMKSGSDDTLEDSAATVAQMKALDQHWDRYLRQNALPDLVDDVVHYQNDLLVPPRGRGALRDEDATTDTINIESGREQEQMQMLQINEDVALSRALVDNHFYQPRRSTLKINAASQQRGTGAQLQHREVDRDDFSQHDLAETKLHSAFTDLIFAGRFVEVVLSKILQSLHIEDLDASSSPARLRSALFKSAPEFQEYRQDSEDLERWVSSVLFENSLEQLEIVFEQKKRSDATTGRTTLTIQDKKDGSTTSKEKNSLPLPRRAAPEGDVQHAVVRVGEHRPLNLHHVATDKFVTFAEQRTMRNRDDHDEHPLSRNAGDELSKAPEINTNFSVLASAVEDPRSGGEDSWSTSSPGNKFLVNIAGPEVCGKSTALLQDIALHNVAKIIASADKAGNLYNADAAAQSYLAGFEKNQFFVEKHELFFAELELLSRNVKTLHLYYYNPEDIKIVGNGPRTSSTSATSTGAVPSSKKAPPASSSFSAGQEKPNQNLSAQDELALNTYLQTHLGVAEAQRIKNLLVLTKPALKFILEATSTSGLLPYATDARVRSWTLAEVFNYVALRFGPSGGLRQLLSKDFFTVLQTTSQDVGGPVVGAVQSPFEVGRRMEIVQNDNHKTFGQPAKKLLQYLQKYLYAEAVAVSPALCGQAVLSGLRWAMLGGHLEDRGRAGTSQKLALDEIGKDPL
ncbi:unnamed protein product [Amoebophrya sp. A120]|nr:unnamed protein product [Amoebophrya sp. A120]|eukprot:GSA120T00012040001.1